MKNLGLSDIQSRKIGIPVHDDRRSQVNEVASGNQMPIHSSNNHHGHKLWKNVRGGRLGDTCMEDLGTRLENGALRKTRVSTGI